MSDPIMFSQISSMVRKAACRARFSSSTDRPGRNMVVVCCRIPASQQGRSAGLAKGRSNGKPAIGQRLCSVSACSCVVHVSGLAASKLSL